MRRIESSADAPGAPYDRRAALYDGLVRSRIYNNLAWSSSPADYAAFAARAVASDDGPLLDAGAGSAAATAHLHAHSNRPSVLLDLSRAMLERADARIDAAGTPAGHVRLCQADLLDPPFPRGGFTTVLAMGVAHLFEDLPALLASLRGQLASGGGLYLTSLVGETRRGRAYLRALHRASELATPLTADQLCQQLGRTRSFTTRGCMAYAILDA